MVRRVLGLRCGVVADRWAGWGLPVVGLRVGRIGLVSGWSNEVGVGGDFSCRSHAPVSVMSDVPYFEGDFGMKGRHSGPGVRQSDRHAGVRGATGAVGLHSSDESARMAPMVGRIRLDHADGRTNLVALTPRGACPGLSGARSR